MQLPRVVRRKKRIGRGIGGRGAKSGRGMKGQKARAGYRRRAGFEGGQTPLYMRLPKGRGTKQIDASQVARPAALGLMTLKRWRGASIVGPGALRKAGLIRRGQAVKLIGTAALDRALTVRVHAISAQARAAIERAGGRVELIGR